MYNLNDNNFDAKQGVTIFNNGMTGRVNDVTMTVYKKKPEDKPNAPDYKLMFSDENGGECSTSYWYVTKDTQYNTVDEQIRRQGIAMKHAIHAIYGPDFEIPVKATSGKELLDQSMKVIKDGLTSQTGKYRIFATYGTLNAVRDYIQPRSWVPFMESMSVDEKDSRLKLAVTIDAMERIQKDTVDLVAKADELIDGDDW